MILQGKVAVVTGSSVGVGRAAAIRFAERGCSVVINYSRSKAEAEEAAELCRATGAKAVVVQADVSIESDCRRLIKTAVDNLGRLDILVNNAAVTKFIEFSDLDALTEDIWMKIIRTNVLGNYFCCRAAVPEMRKAGQGAIVNVVSIAGVLGGGSSIAYSASKAADLITLCDTNGGSLPGQIKAAIGRVQATITLPLGIHCHNDSDLAVANTLAAVESGIVHVQGTMNGYGERCGNANLCSIIPNLELKMGYAAVGPERLKLLTNTSKFVSQIANLPHRKDLSFVGESAFAHKGGIHVSAIIKDAATYEHMDPQKVGNSRRVLVSELSGRSNLIYKAHEMNMDIAEYEEKLKPALNRIKKLENQGYEFEAAEASIRVLMETALNGEREFFKIDNFRVVTDMHRTGEVTSEATVKIRVGDQSVHTVAEGDGPVHALDKALRLALNQFFEPLRGVQLTDYKVRVLEGNQGTGSRVRVHIQQSDGEENWTTVGVSENILEASYLALADGIRYKLLKSN